MDYREWQADFERWYDATNRLMVEQHGSMPMLDELRERFEASTEVERRWMVETLHRWQFEGNQYQQYDARRLLDEFAAELDGDSRRD